jgi:hypothetical protein
MTIHMIGKRPNAAPSAATSRAWPTGMPHAKIPMKIDTTSEMTPAFHAAMRRPPSSTNRVMSGIAANRALSASEPPTESVVCSNMHPPWPLS